MKKRGIKEYLFVILIGVFLYSTCVFADIDKISISQIIQHGNDVYLYVNGTDTIGKPTDDALNAEQFSVNIDESQAFPVLDSAQFQTLDEGVSYIFCVDISKSVTEEEMQEIKNSMTEFVNNMTEKDFARVITIGREITSVCDTTQDKSALVSAIQGIGRTADYTYLYKGISTALDGQRKRTNNIPERAMIILFTDGMDDSDGAYTLDQVVADFAATRIPIYPIGLKGNDPSASLNSVSQIAQQSGGNIFSYNDMSITEALQTIGDIVKKGYQLHVIPEISNFGKKNMNWKVTFSSENYTVSSKPYVYSLSMDDVILPTSTPEETPIPTETAVPTSAPTSVPEVTEEAADSSVSPNVTLQEKIILFWQDNFIICIAVGMIIIALLIIIGILWGRKKGPKQDDSINELQKYDNLTEKGSSEETDDDNEKTMPGEDDEKTIGALDDYDDEKTIAEDYELGVRINFEITFDGKTENVEVLLPQNGELILGRGSECDVDVVLGSREEYRKQTSRMHAFIQERPDGIYVKDNSKNKTFLNGKEVIGELPLQNEDILQMGRAKIKVKFLDD